MKKRCTKHMSHMGTVENTWKSLVRKLADGSRMRSSGLKNVKVFLKMYGAD